METVEEVSVMEEDSLRDVARDSAQLSAAVGLRKAMTRVNWSRVVRTEESVESDKEGEIPAGAAVAPPFSLLPLRRAIRERVEDREADTFPMPS